MESTKKPNPSGGKDASYSRNNDEVRESVLKRQMSQFQENYNKHNEELHNNGEEIYLKKQKIFVQGGAIANDESNLLHEFSGALQKYSPSLFSSWQTRHFVLHNKKVKWYHKATDVIPQGVLNFDFFKCEVALVSNDKRCFNLTLLGSDRVFHFRAVSQDECLEWKKRLAFHIENSEGHN